MFKVGQKVVCVDDAPGKYRVSGISYIDGLHGLRRGEIYTIRSIEFSPRNVTGISVRLDEIIRPPAPLNYGEPGYAIARFRPVQETGMEMLRAILVNPKSPVKEDA